MPAAALIVLREVLEAALVVGILLAAVRGVAGARRWIAGGILTGVAGAAIVALFTDHIAQALEGVGQEVFNALVLLVAAAVLGWHQIWMQRHGRVLAGTLRARGADIRSGASRASVLLLVVALAVMREGAEVALFLYGVAAGGTGAGAVLAGGLTGLAAGVATGVLAYYGLLAVPERYIFSVTGWMLLLLAAGMAAQSTGYLVQAGWLPGLVEPLWDSSWLVSDASVPGQVLHVLTGYVARPSALQVIVFAAVAGLLGLLSRRYSARALRRPAHAAAAWAGISLLAAFPAAERAEAAHVIYSPIVEEGEIAFEVRSHRDFDSDRATDGTWQHKVDVEYAPTARWLTELVVELEKAPGETTETTAVAWENILQVFEQGERWMDFGLLAEYEHSLERGGEDKLELGALFEKQLARDLATLNLIVERELGGEEATELEYALRYRWRVDPRFEPVVELYGEFGEAGEFGSLDDHEHSAGPGLMGATRLGRAGKLHYEVAWLVGLTDESPDSTFRVLLEFEF
jgi:FTR1 family protein